MQLHNNIQTVHSERSGCVMIRFTVNSCVLLTFEAYGTFFIVFSLLHTHIIFVFS